jgi:hypothetical protein
MVVTLQEEAKDRQGILNMLQARGETQEQLVHCLQKNIIELQTDNEKYHQGLVKDLL